MAFFEAIWEIFTSDSTYVNAALFAGLLLFAASGEWVAERAGTINISVEGMLLAGAFTSAVGYDLTDSVIVALVAGALGGAIVASVQAEMSHRLPADQFVVGLTLNILLLGLVGFLDREIDTVTRAASKWDIPLLSDLPLVGQALFSQPWPFYLLYVLVPFSWWLMFRTRWIETRPDSYRSHKWQYRNRSRHGVRRQRLSAGRDHGGELQRRATQNASLSRRQGRADTCVRKRHRDAEQSCRTR